MPASPTNSKTDYVFPVGIHTSTFIKHIYVCTWLATQINTDRNTYGNTNSTNGLILLPSPADQNDSPSTANIYTYIYVAGLRHSVCPVTGLGYLDPRILSFPSYWHLDIQSPSKAAAPFANESSGFNDLLINTFIYAITTSLTEDQNFQLSHRSQLTA